MNNHFFRKNRFLWFTRSLCFILILTLTASIVFPSSVQAQVLNSQIKSLPVHSVDQPIMIQGMTIYPDRPLTFDFIIDSGESHLKDVLLREESQKLIKYFIAALATSEKDMWVNLSPYEPDRIVPQSFGQTEMGRDLLAQDYLLKQITSSMMHPDGDIGKKFWDKIYQMAYEKYGVTDVPVDTFNKVWIVPQETSVYENASTNTVFISKSTLDVMLEGDYLAQKNSLLLRGDVEISNSRYSDGRPEESQSQRSFAGAQDDGIQSIIREIILPELKKEVNEGESFAPLRQIMNSLILAKWYKGAMKTSILNQAFSNQQKTSGVEVLDPNAKQEIYEQYIQAFRQGAYDVLKEDYDPAKQEMITKKYFSGGIQIKGEVARAMLVPTDLMEAAEKGDLVTVSTDLAMMSVEQGVKVFLFLVVCLVGLLFYSHKDLLLKPSSSPQPRDAVYTIHVQDNVRFNVRLDYEVALKKWEKEYLRLSGLKGSGNYYLRKQAVEKGISDFLKMALDNDPISNLVVTINGKTGEVVVIKVEDKGKGNPAMLNIVQYLLKLESTRKMLVEYKMAFMQMVGFLKAHTIIIPLTIFSMAIVQAFPVCHSSPSLFMILAFVPMILTYILAATKSSWSISAWGAYVVIWISLMEKMTMHGPIFWSAVQSWAVFIGFLTFISKDNKKKHIKSNGVDLKNKEDNAQLNGGIDLEKTNVERLNDRESSIKINFTNDPAMLENLKNATGLRAIIHDIKPVTLPMLNGLLGLNMDGTDQNKSADSGERLEQLVMVRENI